MRSLLEDKLSADKLLGSFNDGLIGKFVNIYFWQPTLTDLQLAQSLITAGSNNFVHAAMGLTDVRGLQNQGVVTNLTLNSLNYFISLGLLPGYQVSNSPQNSGDLVNLSVGRSFLPPDSITKANGVITTIVNVGVTIVEPSVDSSQTANSEAVVFFDAGSNIDPFHVLHEMGHVIGFNHPDRAGVSSLYNSQKFTVQSYNGHDSFLKSSNGWFLNVVPDSLMLLDYLALQNKGLLYKTAYKADSTNYTWDVADKVLHTIYDTDGTDTISAEGHTRNTIIDLRAGHFSSYGASDKDNNAPLENLAIAYGTVIENAIGGDKDDVLIGNQIGNELKGGEGNDFLYGDGSIYKTDGWAFSQKYKDAYSDNIDEPTNSFADQDILYGGEGHDYIAGGGGDDSLFGEAGSDHLEGGAEDDELDGGDGNDILEGGAGNDKYIFTGQFGRDMIKDSDNQGSIVINGSTLSELTQTAKDGIIYYDDINNPTRKAVLIKEGNTESLIISTVTKTGNNIVDSGNSITIKNWNGSNLGIILKDAVAPAATTSMTVNGNDSDNAISLDNLHDDNESLDISNTALKAHGGAGRDLIMGMLSTNDTLLGGDGDDIISGGFSDNLSNVMVPVASTPGIDNIDGGKGEDHIFASVGGSVAHGGDDNDVLSSDRGFFGLIDKLSAIEIIGNNSDQVSAHGAASRDEIWGDALARMNFYVEQTEDGYVYHTDYYKYLTAEYTLYTGAVSGINYIGKLDNNAFSVNSNAAIQLNFSGVYSLYYDFAAKDGLHPIANVISSPIHFSGGYFELRPGRKYAEFAHQTGANLFGDKGDDIIFGGMYADYLSGGDDKDQILAGEGHDVLDGGDGDDLLVGQDGNDLLIGGLGNDTLYSSAVSNEIEAGVGDNDTVYGGAGNDGIVSGIGDDYLDGGAGIDTMNGGAGNDYLYGGDDEDKDNLNGDADDDILVMGKNDVANGGSGNNIYIWDTHQVTTTPTPPVSNANLTSSNNSLGFTLSATATSATVTAPSAGTIGIFNSNGNNTLAIAGQRNLTDFSLRAFDNYLSITTSDNQKILIADAQTSAPVKMVFGNSIEQLAATPVDTTPITDEHFLNGIDPLAQVQLTTADFMLGALQDAVTLTASTTTQYLVGGLANDTLTANAVGSKLIGGRGDDHLNGDVGNDTYLIRAGDGNDIITDKGGNNTIKFSQDILPGMVDVTRNAINGNLQLRINNGDLIQVAGMFDANGNINPQNAVQQIQFANGDVWNAARLVQEIQKPRTFVGTDYADTLFGGEGSDTLIGKKGNDALQGGAANDVYRYAVGDGNDVIQLQNRWLAQAEILIEDRKAA